MPGSLLRGYLQAQQYTQEEEELAEEKKRRKLEEALNQLNLQRGRRTIEREAEEWKYQERKRAEIEEEKAKLTEEELKKYLFGIPLPEIELPTGGLKVGAVPWAKGWGMTPTGLQYTEPTEEAEGRRTPEELAKLIGTFTSEVGEEETGLEAFADSLRNLMAERVRGEEFPRKLQIPTGTGMGEYARGLPEISLPGQPAPAEETFHGAESYGEVVEAVANIPEPKRSQILEEAKAFFGIE